MAAGKKARLHRILFQHGLGNGTAIFLPYDQGLEHGPRDFFANPAAGDPRYILELALEGGFNGIALQIGLAEKFYWDYAGRGAAGAEAQRQDRHPADAEALSPLQRDASRTRSGSAPTRSATRCMWARPAQERDFEQYRRVREDAQRLGMPLIVWAYPRGSAIEAKGGKDSFYAVDYAARTASELGADVVKVNFPHPEKHVGRGRALRRRVLHPAGDRRGGPVGEPDPGAGLRRGDAPATRPCWRRRASRWRPAPPG